MTRADIISGAVWGCVMFPTAYLLGFDFGWRLILLLFIASMTEKILDGPK